MKLEMYALYRMIYECCGEGRDVLENVEITEISPNHYHVCYKEDNPYEGLCFDIAVSIEELFPSHKNVAHYSITNSVYGDDGEFELDL